MLLLPDDLALFKESAEAGAIDPDGFSIARAARMSMSIPYFFEPVVLYRGTSPLHGARTSTYTVGQWHASQAGAAVASPSAGATDHYLCIGSADRERPAAAY